MAVNISTEQEKVINGSKFQYTIVAERVEKPKVQYYNIVISATNKRSGDGKLITITNAVEPPSITVVEEDNMFIVEGRNLVPPENAEDDRFMFYYAIL